MRLRLENGYTIVSPGRRVQFNLPLPARELLRADDNDTMYYQVLGARTRSPPITAMAT